MVYVRILLGIYLGLELLGQMVTLCLIFKIITKLFSKGAVPFYTLTNKHMRVSISLYLLQYLLSFYYSLYLTKRDH